MTDRTPPHTPSDQVSDEATRRGLALAHEQGDVYGKALRHMAEQVAKGGGAQRAGEYTVGWAYEDPEGLYHWRDGELMWEEPPDDANVHVEIAVRDGADGRFVFGLGVHLTILDASGRGVGSHDLPFLWHPSLYHYGANIRVPGSGTYTLRARIQPPTYSRHDRVNGRRFIEVVTAEFDRVQLAPRRS